MKKLMLCILIIVISAASLISLDGKLLSRNILSLYEDSNFIKEGLKRVEEFNPDEDAIYLPPLGKKDLFESINDMSIFHRKDVRKYIYIYLTKGRKYIIRALRRSNLYIDIIKEKFKRYPEIPEEIVLLPLLESGFNPYAVSRSRAVGLWQFIRPTSRILGLKNNRWIDERRDVEKSTHAAIRHLKNLYGIFQSWDFTLAAYNGGAGHVMRAMKKTDKRNFWELHKTGVLKPHLSRRAR